MHPVSKVHFGEAEGQIAVKFHNGTAVVSGYIVKQVGSVRYVVAEVGSEERFTCSLASTTEEANDLVQGKMTIEIAPYNYEGVQNVKNLSAFIAFTTQGERLSWKRGPATKEGEGQIAVISAPVVEEEEIAE